MMKIFLIILVVLVGLFLVFQVYLMVTSNKTAAQPYRVIQTKEDFEIRFYPEATMAQITSSEKSYSDLGRSGFSKLAGYIFGGNEARKKIAMTAPVHMEISDSAASMSFVMPSGYNKDNLPQPNDPDVKIITTKDEYVAVLTFGGFISDRKIKKYAAQLAKALKSNSISYYGNFRVLGYNPPYQLLGRKNEIMVSVKWDSK